MKRPSTIYDLSLLRSRIAEGGRFTIWKKSAASAAANHQSSIINHQSRQGVALVITLILLAVVTFMALTFLAVSRRERGAVTTSTDTASAKLAADDALAAAEGQIVAHTLATTNPYGFGLLVSTNYINPYGFVAGIANPTNVNYNYYNTGPGPLAPADFLQNLANLYYLPRVPVYATNLIFQTNVLQFYLDLNRNGRDDANGYVPEIGNKGGFIHPDGTEDQINANVVTNVHVGDPEWIGVLQHPDQPYGPNNPFVARYAFVASPIGNALDLNAIHNQVLDAYGGRVAVNPPGNVPGAGDTFMRNQGVGSWEINLAAFLADLNTNQWLRNPPPDNNYYAYNRTNVIATFSSANAGLAFDDARALLAYRYQNDYGSLKSASVLFPNNRTVFLGDRIDEYGDGPLQTGFPLPNDFDNLNFPWAGADNTNQFFDLQELYDISKTGKGLTPFQLAGRNDFSDRLLNIGFAPSTYNRYTYYRLLSQMGLDSAPEQNKLNLNYLNVDNNGNVVPGMQTNLIPWTALQFFTNAADRMLRDDSQAWMVASPSNFVATFNLTNTFGLGNIPVWVSNRFVYTPAVQRVLQLAANMYDAIYYYSNNAVAPVGPGYPATLPTVFRPFFNKVIFPGTPPVTNVYICGFSEVTNAYQNNPFGQPLSAPFSLENPNTLNVMRDSTLGPNYINIYGVPWIIGAKKGFPNFNEFAMESAFQLTRKLQVTRPNTNSPVSDYQYNQMFNLSLTNQLGVECWNSYTNSYNRAVDIYVTNYLSVTLTNDENVNTNLNFMVSGALQISSLTVNAWPGYNAQIEPIGSQSFKIPLDNTVDVIPTSMYRFNVGGNVEEPGHVGPYLTTNLDYPWGNSLFESGVTMNGQLYPQPHWWMMTTNNLQVIMIDHVSGGIIDYVQLSGPNSYRDLTSEVISNYDTAAGPDGNDLWNTNIQNNLPIGLISLIGVSLGNYPPGLGGGAWASQSESQREDEIDGFRAFFHYSPLFNNANGQQYIAKVASSNYTQAPYLPTATVVQHFSWQANDPLIHYIADDLNWSGANQLNRTADDLTNEDLGQLNQRYMPWGGNPLINADRNPVNLALKDPLVRQSDDWDFPTYKFPTAGWLGRVHRGTPWQTVYLKSPDILQQAQISGRTTNYIGTNTWMTWTGNGNSFDAANMAPGQDRLLFDVFSTALNDNITRGQLSVNVGAGDPSPQAGLAAWSALFSGVLVLSNNAVDAAIPTNNISGIGLQHARSVANTWLPINPAGPAGSNSALGQLVAGVNQTRTNFVNPDGLAGTFEHVGDILAVPALTWQSPFLNWNDTVQQANGISDEMYEWLPQQVMSLLRVSDTPRFVIYSYGQALKPAPNGISTANIQLANGQSAFGMVTNYQVVAEAATRAVVRFDGTRINTLTNDGVNWMVAPSVTNNHAVIEQFNALPAN